MKVKHLHITTKTLLILLLQENKVTVQSNKHFIMDNWLNLTGFRSLILDQTDQTNLHMVPKLFHLFHLRILLESQCISSLVNTILLLTQQTLLLVTLNSQLLLNLSIKNMIWLITSVSWLEKLPLSMPIFLNKSQQFHLPKRLKNNYQWTTHSLRMLTLTYIEISQQFRLPNPIIYLNT